MSTATTVDALAAHAQPNSASLWDRTKRFFVEHSDTIKWFVIVIAALLAIAILSLWNERRTQRFSKDEVKGVRNLLYFANSSAQQAQKSLASPLQALLHVNYSICFINAAKHMVGESTLQSLADFDVATLHAQLENTQANLLMKINQQCLKPSATQRDVLQS